MNYVKDRPLKASFMTLVMKYSFHRMWPGMSLPSVTGLLSSAICETTYDIIVSVKLMPCDIILFMSLSSSI